MATRLKTIEYVLPRNISDVAEGTSYTDSADTTIYIPETSSRVIKSALLYIYWHDNHATVSADISDISIRGSCDSGSNWTTVDAISGSRSDSGENFPYFSSIDMTAEFTARFGSGSSGTFRYGFFIDYTATGPTVTNITAKIVITYEYDDTSATTRVKTVRIPIETLNGYLSDTHQAIKQTSTASNQIPDLNDFLPEASKTYRSIFLEIYLESVNGTTNNVVLYMKIDSGGTEVAWGTIQGANQSNLSQTLYWDISSLDTANPHELYARHNDTGASSFYNIGAILTVTYEYDHANSTSILNSLVVCPVDPREYGDTASNQAQGIGYFDLFIEEPTTITMVQSGVVAHGYRAPTTNDFVMYAGSQSPRIYDGISSAVTGHTTIVHRIDSGGHSGGAFTLTRGKNSLLFAFYNSIAGAYNYKPIAIINYTSGKHSSGDGVHNHTIFSLVGFDNQPGITNHFITFSCVSIPETDYFINDYYLEGNFWGGSQVQGTFMLNFLDAESYIYKMITLGMWASGGAENAYHFIPFPLRNYFYRWAGDSSNRMNPENNRRLGWAQASFSVGWVNILTYHSITYTVSGTISGSGGGTVYWDAFSKAIGKLPIASGNRSGNGTYSFTWYDDTSGDVYVRAREDATHLGSSDDGAGT